MSPTVSVIIPTYNRKRTLKRAVDSVLHQSYKDFELIVVDDASTDGTEQCDFVLNRDAGFIFVKRTVNCGVSSARNLGVKRSSGTWVAFLDSDDEWHKDKLNKQMRWLSQHPDSRIMQTKEIWIRKGKRVNPPKSHEKRAGDIFDVSLERCMITPSSVIMQRSLFNEMGGFNESIPACEDFDLWLKISSRYPVGLLDELLMTRHGGHEDQLSSSVMGLDRFRIRAILDLLTYAELDQDKAMQARKALVQKAHIVANGYKKRGNEKLYEQYEEIAGKWARI